MRDAEVGGCRGRAPSREWFTRLKYGLTTWQIAQRTGFDAELTRSLAYKIRHPDWANRQEQARRKDQLEQRVPWRNERDGEGWRVPWPGTKSRMIYGLLKYGLTTQQIAEVTGFKRGLVRVWPTKSANRVAQPRRRQLVRASMRDFPVGARSISGPTAPCRRKMCSDLPRRYVRDFHTQSAAPWHGVARTALRLPMAP